MNKNKMVFALGFIIIGIIIGIGVFSYINYNNDTKEVSQSKKEEELYFDTKYYDLITDGLNMKINAISLIDTGDKYSVYGTSMDFNGFVFRIISDKYTGKIKEVDIEINKKDTEDGINYLLFFSDFRNKVLKYLGVSNCDDVNTFGSELSLDNCYIISSVKDNKYKCVIVRNNDN